MASAGALRLELNSFACQAFTGVRLALLDSAATQLSIEDLSSLTACRLMVAQVQPGTYYVAVSRTQTGSQPLPYWITPTLNTARTTEVEPNDTTNQANLVTGADVVMCGALGTTTDFTDDFIFTLSQPAVMHAEVLESSTMSTTCESNLLDSRLELLSGAGLQLLTNADTGRGLCSRVESVGTLTAGTYFLRVTETASPKRGFPYCVSLRLR